MGENHHRAATSSRIMRIKHFGGEIVEVQGGHIVRSTGRKDRHSKVCTAKGPRDRRVRLSAHTAIQFYDVQDRLGYDRPSKAVDWLIKKAKTAIDELAELPPWNPLNTTISTKKTEDPNTSIATANEFHIENLDNDNNNSDFLPPSLVSDEIADTIKYFFPLGASSETSNHSQDLQLSLHHEHPQGHHSEPALFYGTTALGGFDGCSSGWEHHHHQSLAEIGRFPRLFAWNSSSGGGGDTGGGNGGGFLFGTPSQPPLTPPDFGQSSQFFTQREPLQSSNIPLVRAWIDQPIDEHHHHHHQILQNIHHQDGIGFTTTGVFSSFRVPSRIQGEEEEQHDSIAHKLSSASSDSHH